MIALVKHSATPFSRAKAAARPMRHQAHTAGARLADLAALGKAIVLSEFAARKWNPRAYGYVPHPVHPRVQGVCDATAVRSSDLTLFIKES